MFSMLKSFGSADSSRDVRSEKLMTSSAELREPSEMPRRRLSGRGRSSGGAGADGPGRSGGSGARRGDRMSVERLARWKALVRNIDGRFRRSNLSLVDVDESIFGAGVSFRKSVEFGTRLMRRFGVGLSSLSLELLESLW